MTYVPQQVFTYEEVNLITEMLTLIFFVTLLLLWIVIYSECINQYFHTRRRRRRMTKLKTQRKAAFLIMVIVFILNTILPLSVNASADSNVKSSYDNVSIVTPPAKNNNANKLNSFFKIIDGTAHVQGSYEGYYNITTGATITIKIQKKVWFWWSDVNNGQPDNTWTDVLYGWKNSAIHSLALTSTGEYRAIITYTVRGSGGADDVIPVTIYDTYE